MMDEGGRIVVLCTDDPGVMESVAVLSAVGYSAISCSTLRELELELSESVVAVVLDASLPKDQTFAIYRHLRQRGNVPFLVLLPPPGSDQANWIMDMDHGEQEDFARQPISIPELVLRINALLIRSGRMAPGALSFSGQGGGNDQVAAALSGYGKIIAVYGAHGGIGKTTLAVNVAIGLSRLAHARVVLIDGDLWMGDSVVVLNLTATRTILDATANGIPNDPEVWTRVLVDHPTGIKVLAPPVHLEDVERVPEGAVAAAAQGLRRYFDYVIVDLDDTPTENTLKVLEAADQVLLVVTPELSVVRNTLRILTTGADIGLKDRVRLILNRSDTGLEQRQVESVLPSPVVATIPSDGRLFVAAVNSGLSVFEVENATGTRARRALEALVKDVASYGRPKPRREGGMFSGLAAMGSRAQKR